VVLNLDQVGLKQRPQVGAKAAALGRLARAGLPVPPGVVVLDVEAWARLLLDGAPQALPAGAGGSRGWIARSSAPDEDGDQASFAGQLLSVADLRTHDALVDGAREVARSASRAQTYAAARGLRPEQAAPCPLIPVLVQPQVPALRAGVLFSVDPLGQRRLCFAVDWTDGADGLVTDGADQGRMKVFDPLSEADRRVQHDEVMDRALPRLVEATFAALAALGPPKPLDLEWLVDGNERLWIVQARPVTSLRRQPHPEVQALLSRSHWLQSKRPVSRYAARSYMEAAASDRAAAPRYHGYFQRRTIGTYLLARRVKICKRPEVTAFDPVGFLAQWAWLRRHNLRFAAVHFSAWLRADTVRARRAERLLATDPASLTDHQLGRALGRCLQDNRAVRRAHAAMWYPVDLIKDAQTFARRFAHEAAARDVSLPRRRTRRDREGKALVRRARHSRGGRHPRWQELLPGERRRVLRYLCRHPYTFQCAEEVQDLALWSSHREHPARWWDQQAHLRDEELVGSLRKAGRQEEGEGSADTRKTPALTAACGQLLRLVVRRFAPLKDDRVELLALSCSAVRHLCLELQRRAQPTLVTRIADQLRVPGPACLALPATGRDEPALPPTNTRPTIMQTAMAQKSWIFELEPAEMLALARGLDTPAVLRHLREVAVARLRARLLEELAIQGEQAEQPRQDAAGDAGALRGQALARGRATGRARVVRTPTEALRHMAPGEVLVTDEIRPSFSQVMPRAAALVSRRGSPLCHGAIVARELGIPAVALGNHMDQIVNGQLLKVDGQQGVVVVES